MAEAALAAGVVGVLATGAALRASGQISFAHYPPVIVLASFAFVPLTEISVQLRNLGIIRGSAERVFTITQAPANVVDSGTQPAEVHLPPVRFDETTFRYRPDDPLALAGVSFEIPAGQTVALVGHSGSGKSTCANLLLRFWDPDHGAVLIDGTDTRTWPVAALRDLVSLVPQDVYLFNTSIRDNIRLSRPDATAADVEAAAERALVAEFIPDLPDGLNT